MKLYNLNHDALRILAFADVARAGVSPADRVRYEDCASRTTDTEVRDKQALGDGTRRATGANVKGTWVRAENVEKVQLANSVMSWS